MCMTSLLKRTYGSQLESALCEEIRSLQDNILPGTCSSH